MIDKKLVEHKQMVKKKQPRFIRQEAHKRKKLGDSWRKPKGVHSKLRLRRRGKPKMVSVGYKMPDQVRGISKAGLRIVYISSVAQLKTLTKEYVAVMSKVSKKQRLKLLVEAQKLGISFINFKDITKEVEAIKKKLGVKKEARKFKEERKKKRAEEEKKKAKMSEKQAKKVEPTKEQKEKIEKAAEKAKEEIKDLKENIKKEIVKKAVKEEKPKEKPTKKKAESKPKPKPKKAEKKPAKEDKKNAQS